MRSASGTYRKGWRPAIDRPAETSPAASTVRHPNDEIAPRHKDVSHGAFLATNKQKILQNKLTSGKLLLAVALVLVRRPPAGGPGVVRSGRRRRCGEHRRPEISA